VAEKEGNMGINVVPNTTRPEPTFFEMLGSIGGGGGGGANIPQSGLASYQPAMTQQAQPLQMGFTGAAQADDLQRYIQNYYKDLSNQGDMQGLMNMARAFQQPTPTIQQGYQNPYVTGLMGAK